MAMVSAITRLLICAQERGPAPVAVRPNWGRVLASAWSRTWFCWTIEYRAWKKRVSIPWSQERPCASPAFEVVVSPRSMSSSQLDENPARRAAETYNIGRGEGVTVLEVLDTVRAVTGIDFTAEIVGRRAGDPQAVAASAHAADETLAWRATRDLHEMVRSAWDAWQLRQPVR